MLFNMVLEVLDSAIRQQKDKSHPNWQGRSQTFTLHRWHDTLHRKPERLHQEIANTDIQIQYSQDKKISTQKSVAFLYTNNEAAEKEIKESIPFVYAPKTIEYLGINLSKEVKDLYSEIYKREKKEIEEDTKKWKTIPCSWIRRTNIVKCP